MGRQGGSATICLDSVAGIPSTPGKEGRGLKPVDACTVLRKRVAVMVVSHVVEYVLLGVGVHLQQSVKCARCNPSGLSVVSTPW